MFNTGVRGEDGRSSLAILALSFVFDLNYFARGRSQQLPILHTKL